MRTWIALLALVLSAASAEAHKPSDSHLELVVDGDRVDGRWDIALRDLEQAIGLDRDGDGAITWGEVRAREAEIAAYALSRLELANGDRPCALAARGQRITRHTDGAYAVLAFEAACGDEVRALSARYTLLFDLDPQHRGVARVAIGDRVRTLLFSADHQAQRLDPVAGGSRWATVGDFWRDGVWHIWIGFDHILFLLALLLPAVLRRDGSGWQARSFRDAFYGTLAVVTAFTVSHSITLTLAALGTVHLPSRLVESAIAASVVIASLNNVWPVLGERRWLAGFAFGLLHGFGFASVLADAGVPAGELAAALFGFNLGVESGQLAIVCAFLPLAHAARQSWLYQRFTLVLGSSLVALLGTVWLLERAFDLALLS